MLNVIKPVDQRLLIEANNAVAARKGKGDAAVTLVVHFNNRLDSEELIAINYRLMALAKVIQDGKVSAWVIGSKGKKYKLVNEAMFRAAATTSLSIDDADLLAHLSFDIDEFLNNALEASKADGTA